jgi:geranylgeranyl pyrophosphate synthase
MHGDPPAGAYPLARLVGGGGKRLRSRLALAAADVGPTPRPGLAVQYAAALEILHSASLAHDDYIDASPLRRNAPTIAALEGAERAVTVGHYYFGKALQAVIELEQRNVLATVAAALRAICRSQTDELFRRGRASGWTSYVRIAHGKTGALFAAASAGGAELSGTRRPLVARLRSYGDLIGVAFQITDDLIDFSDATGKPVGQDIRTGTLSLPIRYALEDEVVGPELRAILGRPLDDEATVERVIVAVTATDAIARAREHAERLVERALGILSTRDLDRARPALVHLARMAVDRAA